MALPKGVDMLPSGTFRARFKHGGKQYRSVWDTPAQAEAWIRRTRRDLTLGIHEDTGEVEPETLTQAAPIFTEYADNWLAHRKVKGRPLKAGTRNLYRAILDDHLIPQFGAKRLDSITSRMISDWHKTLLPDAPTRRSHVYGLLNTILGSAAQEDVIPANPCKVRGAGAVDRATTTELPTVEQVTGLIAAMPGPKYQCMTALAAWCGLRFGELTELRRRDIVVDSDGVPVMIRVRRAVYRDVVDTPKSGAGVRDVGIPPHVRRRVSDWLETRPKSADTMLFPATRTGGHIKASSLYKAFYPARVEAGVPTLRWHDLRHFSGTATAQTGASLKEIMSRLGHSTVNAAMRYQHAAADREVQISEAMSQLAAG